MRVRTLTATAILLSTTAAALVAQPQSRRATTITAIRNYPGFYHQQTVLVVGDVTGTPERATIGTDEAALTLVAREVREGRIEARGQVLDVGRLAQDDPRLIPFNLLDRVRAQYQDRWPKPGEELILLLGGTAPAPSPANVTAPPLRAVAMEPAKFEGQAVTIVGQFRGRNLFGDLPEAPAQNRYSFVLRSSDAALWVMGVQSKGRDFNFDPAKRIDTGRWVKVQGTVRTAKGLTWLDGTSIELAPEPEQITEVAIDLPPPPVEILFTAPAEGEAEVRSTERIRMQLSRDLDEASLKDRIRLTYAPADATAPPIEFTTSYTRDNRALEIKPAEPLERFKTVKLEILEGVKGTDGGALAPFTLTFTVGGA